MYWFLLTICKTDSLGTTCDKGLAVLKIDINIQIVEVYQNQVDPRACGVKRILLRALQSGRVDPRACGENCASSVINAIRAG